MKCKRPNPGILDANMVVANGELRLSSIEVKLVVGSFNRTHIIDASGISELLLTRIPYARIICRCPANPEIQSWMN